MLDKVKRITTRTLIRAKKILWLLVLLPIVIAVGTFFFSSEQETTYRSSGIIMLGNFQNGYYTDPNIMKTLIPSYDFLKSLNENYDYKLDIEELSKTLTVVSTPQDRTLTISLSGTEKEKVEADLDQVLDGVIEESNKVLYRKKEFLEEITKKAKDDSAGSLPPYQTELLYKLGTDNLEYQHTRLIKDVTTEASTPITPFQKSILGFLIGLMLNLFILALPEVFREE